MLHIGIDEAGYGPVVGPFVVGASVFRFPGETEPFVTNLRDRLRGLVVRANAKRCDSALPVPVDDSKAVFGRFGADGLARGVAAFASAMGIRPPADLRDLLTRFSRRGPSHYAGCPWFADLDRAPVPECEPTGPLRDVFERRRVQALVLTVLPVDVPEWNGRIGEYRNKANVLGLYTGTLWLELLDAFPGEDAEVVLDRHGGRLDYAAYLAGLFPFAPVTARPSPRGEAHYVVQLPDRRLHVRFATRADQTSIAVSWASMAAKLARELFMARLNDWFLRRAPGVRRTAGYRPDGWRFLREVGRVIAEEQIDRARLVRAL